MMSKVKTSVIVKISKCKCARCHQTAIITETIPEGSQWGDVMIHCGCGFTHCGVGMPTKDKFQQEGLPVVIEAHAVLRE